MQVKERAGGEIEESVLRIIKYSNIFSYPLSFYQIACYMDKSLDAPELRKALKNLRSKKIIRKNRGKYSLKGTQTQNWQRSLNKSVKKADQIAPQLEKLGKIPWIKALCITGSLAASDYKENEDIDILIITRKNRVWLTRFFVVLYLKAWGQYYSEEKPEGKFCPNIYLAKGSSEWPEDKRNLYIAQEIVRMNPTINRGDTYQHFLDQNRWISEYVPNLRIWEVTEEETDTIGPLDIIDRVFYLLQRLKMSKDITTERISYNLCHFNKNDNSEEILEAYKSSINL